MVVGATARPEGAEGGVGRGGQVRKRDRAAGTREFEGGVGGPRRQVKGGRRGRLLQRRRVMERRRAISGGRIMDERGGQICVVGREVRGG